MTVAIYTGLGGAGTTTVAAAAGIAAARAGMRTLVLSVPGADPLADVLDRGVPSRPEAAEVVPGLWAGGVDPIAGTESAVGALPAAAALLRTGEVPELPAARELLALLDVESCAAAGTYDLVVVDAGPVDRLVDLLAVPEALSFALTRIAEVTAVPGATGTAPASPWAAVLGLAARPSAGYLDVLHLLSGAATAARARLTGPGSTAHLVLPAARCGSAGARRAATALALQGVRVGTVWANGALHTSGAASSVPDAVARPLPAFAAAPVGVEALTRLADALTDGPGAGTAAEPVLVERVAENFRLTMPLPHTEAAAVGLARSGDDLVLTIGSQRRRMPLPAVLRRCRATGAAVADGRLRVEFVPDRRLWPDQLSRADVAGAR